MYIYIYKWAQCHARRIRFKTSCPCVSFFVKPDVKECNMQSNWHGNKPKHARVKATLSKFASRADCATTLSVKFYCQRLIVEDLHIHKKPPIHDLNVDVWFSPPVPLGIDRLCCDSNVRLKGLSKSRVVWGDGHLSSKQQAKCVPNWRCAWQQKLLQ